MSNSKLLKSPLVKKYWMALTGLFLCLFLIGHLAGNLQLMGNFSPENALAFDQYAYFMTHNPAVKLLSYLTYFSILFHAIDGMLIVTSSNRARKEKYAYNKPNANSKWQSRWMGVLGSIILLFIVIHMANFWGRMHFGDLPTYANPADPTQELKSLYALVVAFFQHPEYGAIAALLYAAAMLFLSFHLSHGFQSAFQSMGVNHPKWTPVIKTVGTAFSIFIPLGFAIIPLWIAFGMEVDMDLADKMGPMAEIIIKTLSK